ncbi:hypothetical protein QE389_001248 [Brevundimonas sp. SORGH_AS 993]|nr:hypothetical protein [Brevundimonas sp. SORGH_AS_0993]
MTATTALTDAPRTPLQGLAVQTRREPDLRERQGRADA